MFVTDKLHIVPRNAVGVEYVFELFNPYGIVGLTPVPSPWGRLGWGFQICNPYRDFQRISFYNYLQIVQSIHYFHSNNKSI